MSGAKAGRWRIRPRNVLLFITGIFVGVVGAGYFVMSRVVTPEATSSRLESILGHPVEIRDVSLRLWRLEARVEGLDMESNTTVDAVAFRLDPWAALAGEWRLRNAELTGVTWIMPSGPDQWEPFIRGVLSPMWLAAHADVVMLKSGKVTGPEGREILASLIEGEFVRCRASRSTHGGPQVSAPDSAVSDAAGGEGAVAFSIDRDPGGSSSERGAGGSNAMVGAGTSSGARGQSVFSDKPDGDLSSSECFLARLEGKTAGGDKFSLESAYTISESGDSLALEAVTVSLPGLVLKGDAAGTIKPRPGLTLDLSSEDFFGGLLNVHALMERGPEGPLMTGTAELSNANAPVLMRTWCGLTLLRSGTIDIEVDLVGRGPEWWKNGIRGMISGGLTEIETAVIDDSDPLAAVIPLASSSGPIDVERASAGFELSDEDVLIKDFFVSLDGTVWRGSGKIGDDGRLEGVILGRVPVSALGGGGSALSLVAGLLADGEGKVPVAFRVSGALSRAVLSFDLEAVVQEAADAGRPQAKSLLKAMSKKDRERLRRTVEDLLRGFTVR